MSITGRRHHSSIVLVVDGPPERILSGQGGVEQGAR